MTLLTSHLEISGIDFNTLQPENKQLISTTLLVFHLEISDKKFNCKQL